VERQHKGTLVARFLISEYADLAEITDDEQNQIRLSLTSRPDRKAAVKLLSAKGLSTREIAEQTGWSPMTISRELQAFEVYQMIQKVYQMVRPSLSARRSPAAL